MLIPTELTEKEESLIRKVAELQIRCLKRILNNNIDDDTDTFLYCVSEEIGMDELNEMVEDNIETFQEVVDDPKYLFLLKGGDLKIVKHILSDAFNKKKYREGRRLIRRKLYLIDSFPNHLLN